MKTKAPDSGDGVLRDDEKMREVAKALGCRIDVASDLELFVDLDSEAAYEQFKATWPIVAEHFASSYVVDPSKSGLPKRHVRAILIEPLSELARIALQAALGSDGKREALSVVRSLKCEPNVIIFFEKEPSLETF